MKQPCVIAPSILSANFARLGAEVDAVIDAGADWIHFDVMGEAEAFARCRGHRAPQSARPGMAGPAPSTMDGSVQERRR